MPYTNPDLVVVRVLKTDILNYNLAAKGNKSKIDDDITIKFGNYTDMAIFSL